MSKRLVDLSLLVFAFWLFVLLPMLKVNSAIDPGLAIRFLLTALPISIISLVLLFKSDLIFSYSENFKKALLILFIGFIWMAVSSIQSLNVGDAWWEILRIGTIYLFMPLAYLVLRAKKSVFSILTRFSLVALLIFSVYAFLQIIPLWHDFKLSGILVAVGFDIGSSLGNKNNFAEVIVMLLPMILIGFFKETGKWKYAFITGLIISIFWILILQSSSAWIATSLGAALMMLFLLKFKAKDGSANDRRRKRSWSFITSSAILALILSAFIFSETGPFKTFKSKTETVLQYIKHPELIDSTSSINNNSVFDRVLMYRNSLRMINDHKFLGVGVNNWKLFMPMYGIGGTAFINTGLLTFEHPHNDYLLILAEQGPVGLLLHIALFVFLLFTIVKMMRRAANKDDLYVFAGMFFGLISFMVLSMFAFPRSKYYVMLILMLYAALVFIMEQKEKPLYVISGRVKVLLLVFCICISAAGSAAAWYRLNGEIHTKEILRAQFANNFARMLRETEKAESVFYVMDYSGTPISWYKGMAYFYSNRFPEAVNYYEQALKINPGHLKVLNDLATAYEKTNEKEKAIETYRRALSAAPYFTETLLNLSATYYNTGRIDSALSVINRVRLDKISYRDKKNYDQFLTAILLRKSEQLLSGTYDKDLINSYLLTRQGENDLKEMYDKAGRSEEVFLKLLKDDLEKLEMSKAEEGI
ncbi:MAG TPA: O-antigen ligase family protein [Bacteroidia bacterium]|nr:O-antigen ligase family protein [Bacteroidia bacterium]